MAKDRFSTTINNVLVDDITIFYNYPVVFIVRIKDRLIYFAALYQEFVHYNDGKYFVIHRDDLITNLNDILKLSRDKDDILKTIQQHHNQIQDIKDNIL